jgi:hypothetical protein
LRPSKILKAWNFGGQIYLFCSAFALLFFAIAEGNDLKEVELILIIFLKLIKRGTLKLRKTSKEPKVLSLPNVFVIHINFNYYRKDKK